MAILWLSHRLSPLTYKAAYAPFKPNKSGQRSHPPYYRGCWHGVSRCLFPRYRQRPTHGRFLPGEKQFTTQNAVFLHAAWLGQAPAHCPIFPTAASRRSLARISVPVWGIALSGPLGIIALVVRYTPNQLIPRMPIRYRPKALAKTRCRAMATRRIDPRFRGLSACTGQVAYALRTHPPLSAPRRAHTVRLACIRPAASVHPEPGSNSPLYGCLRPPNRGPCSRRAENFPLPIPQ